MLLCLIQLNRNKIENELFMVICIIVIIILNELYCNV